MEKHNITKKCEFPGVFFTVRYQNAKMHAMHPIWEKEAQFSESCLLSVCEGPRH